MSGLFRHIPPHEAISSMDVAGDSGPQIARQPDGSYLLTMATLIQRGREEVFAALSDVRNVEKITPGWARFRILSDPTVEMGVGTVFDYSVRVRCMRFKWRSEITEWDPPNAFADTQRRGPFSEWTDRHIFTDAGDKATLVQNEITYRVPGGAPIHRLLVRRDLLRAYRHEQRMMHQLLEG